MMLTDQQARDRIAQSLDETLFVEAGAGTGKTEALVGRIVNLIASGDVAASEIAAITFTEKAAAELYDRVLERLDQKREAETDPEHQQLFADATEQLDHAAIETLHAFAARILRLYPIEAGLPPGFNIVDESDALLKFGERWEEELDLLLEDDDLAEPLLAAFDAGLELKHLRELAWALHGDWDRAAADSGEMAPPDCPSGSRKFRRRCGRSRPGGVSVRTRTICSRETSKAWSEYLTRLCSWPMPIQAAKHYASF